MHSLMNEATESGTVEDRKRRGEPQHMGAGLGAGTDGVFER